MSTAVAGSRPRSISMSATNRGRERAVSILDAARDLVAEVGFGGLSMRAVAARVGISHGNLQHYYPSKEALLEALLDYMQERYRVDVASLLAEQAARSPAERFRLAIELFWDRVQDPKTATIFLEVWALSSRAGFFAAALVRKVRAREHKAILRLLQDLSDAPSSQELELRASMIVLVMEGLLVQLARTEMPRRTRDALASAALDAALRIARGSGT